jgi:hypothetical protein
VVERGLGLPAVEFEQRPTQRDEGMRLGPAQQLSRLLQPTLLTPQLGQPGQPVPPLRRPPGAEVCGRPQQLLLCLVPDTAPGEDAGVVCPT